MIYYTTNQHQCWRMESHRLYNDEGATDRVDCLRHLTQWFPMCQFGFENYDTQIRVQIKIFIEVYHLQVFSSHWPNFQPF